MADQGCPNEGSDTRLFGRWGCWIQSHLSWRSTWYPASLTVCFPPFVALNVPIPFAPPHRRYLSIRFGARYDVNWPGYIAPEAAIKAKDIPIIY